MRMGRPTKKRSTRSNKSKETVNPNPPKFSSPTLIVGQISSNVIQSILAPALTDLAITSVEEYADALMVYEQAMVQQKLADGFIDEDDGELEEGEEVELDLDGNIVASSNDDEADAASPTTNNKTNMMPPPSTNHLFTTQNDIDELSTLLTDTSAHFSTPANTYKIHANAAKFERLLDEKYGKFRPFIEAHPQVEVVLKNIQRKYAMGQFSPLRKETPVSKTTAIMVLFMMHRNNVRLEALVLMATFCLVGLQPWALVTLVALGKWEMERRKGRRVLGMPRKMVVCEPYYAREENNNGEEIKEESEEEERAKKYALLTQPVGTKFNPADLSLRDDEYDVLLLGSGVETLYTAALLSRAGRKVCVLSPMEDVSECVAMEKQKQEGGRFAKVPFDVKGANVAHLSKQQQLLAPALSTTTDTQGGIRFARIGSGSDGYAHSILSVPGLGTDAISGETIPVIINAEGPLALAEYCSTCLGDGYPGTDLDGNDNGNSTSLGYIKACRQINAGSGDYYLSKLFASGSDKLKSSESNVYQQATLRPASAFLNKCLPLNAHIRCLMSALGMCNENLSPDHTSMAAHVTHLCAMMNEEGMAYPVGGPRALCHALTSVVEQCGGRVVSGAPLQELLFEKLPAVDDKESVKKKKTKEEKEGGDIAPSSAEGASGPKPRCIGVRLQNGCEIAVSETDGAVVSTLGFIPTFLHLVPADVRTAHGVPPGLPAISERRPLMKILVGLKGTADELSLTGADWYRLPNATLPRDELDALTGQVKFGTIGVDDASSLVGSGSEELGEDETMEITAGRGKRSKASAATASSSTTAEKKTSRSKFTAGASWMKVSFPSAKDPSWSDCHGSVSTCVVTIEADDDFVRMFDTKPQIYSILNNKGTAASGDMERMSGRVVKDLLETFPQLEDKIECIQICGPYRSGLTQNPARFAIKGNKPEMPYPGLFIGGADLTVGDSASGAIVGGWLAANAVMGYSFLDHLYLKKNITSDLKQFIEEPSMATERNGVIVEDLAVPFKEKVIEKKSDEEDANTNTAESSKEE
eukprot:CAMPEP_0172316150 /NCGR_PEP_ID=MMETSP1058-20130122/27481_1 /TAXON_ID=83371 /ORGANISM="Detonula confervacea, Strain CCMP 353" /LENGTH=1040 /DNA_ID=CAMNT_0013030407 /DNA_START=76 /DNA_END=3198 /DNA_ORIENTATION=+